MKCTIEVEKRTKSFPELLAEQIVEKKKQKQNKEKERR